MKIFNGFNKPVQEEQQKQAGKISEPFKTDSLKDKIVMKYQSIENKALTGAIIGVWAVAFVTVIAVCNANDSSRQAAANKEIVVIESQTTALYEEETTARHYIKETKKKETASAAQTTAQPETTVQPETTTVAPPAVAGAVQERETIPIEQLEVVSNEVLYDDVAIVKAPVQRVVQAPSESEMVAPVVDLPQFVNTVNDSSVNSALPVYDVTNDSQDNASANPSSGNTSVNESQKPVAAPVIQELTTYHNCIDISYHQGKIDWAKVKASGIDYAFIRVGYRGYETGKLGKDIRFEENVKGATANGIQVGVYFFSQALTEQEAIEEASVTLNYIRGLNITLPVIIDWETDEGYRTYNTISSDRLTNVISVFCDMVADKGYTPMVYMCKSDFLNRVNYRKLAARYELWVAWYLERYYTDNYSANLYQKGDKMPLLPFEYKVWQYTSKGAVNGINTPVDMNIIIEHKKIYEPKLTLGNRAFIVNKNGSVNLLKGVYASDLEGNEATDNVSVSILNADGKEITLEKALSVSGRYSVKYIFKGTEFAISDSAFLYVREIPSVYYENELWADKGEKNLVSEYDRSKTAFQNYECIEKLLRNKVSAYYYVSLEGISARMEITNGTLGGLQNILSNNMIKEGNYQITYLVNDGKGLSNARTIKLSVIMPEEETTVVEETTTGIPDETTEETKEDINVTKQSEETVITETE